MNVLVTGANGFVGGHLIEALLKKNHKVYANVRNEEDKVNKSAYKVVFDIQSETEIKNSIMDCKLDAVIHLAAQSNVPYAWENPVETVNVNVIGTINLLSAVSELYPNIKIINVGSSEEYGISAKENEFITEKVECLPQNPYASSKLLSGQIALQLAKKRNLKMIHTRPFNHFGPGQRKGFVVSDFASQIVEVEAGIREPKIYVGDLSTWRDFTDVRDIVNAYILLMESSIEEGIFNISSGTYKQIQDILNSLISLSEQEIEIVIDPNKFRISEVQRFAGDSRKIQSAVGWTIEYSFYDSLKETLEWWRN